MLCLRFALRQINASCQQTSCLRIRSSRLDFRCRLTSMGSVKKEALMQSLRFLAVLSIILLLLGNYETAEAQVLQRTFWKANLGVALDAANKGDLREAEIEFKRALLRAKNHLGPPELSINHYLYGRFLRRGYHYKEAVVHLEESWRLSRDVDRFQEYLEDRSEIAEELASAYWSLQKYVEAVPILEFLVGVHGSKAPDGRRSLGELFDAYEDPMRLLGRTELADRLKGVADALLGPRVLPPRPNGAETARASPESVAALFAEAQAALMRKDMAAAFALYQRTAEAGHLEAYCMVGDMLLDGVGTKRDPRAAVAWLKAASERGDACAMRSLGWSFRYGVGVPVDYAEAVRWYRAGAEKGFPDNMMELANMYFEGLGVERDYSTAFGWYLKAARRGQFQAMYNVALLYRDGKGIERNPLESYAWFHALSSVKGQSRYSPKVLTDFRDKVGTELSAEQRKRAEQVGERYWQEAETSGASSRGK